MSREELIEELLELSTIADKEEAHIEADALLLEYIGDQEIKEAYETIDKWFA